MGETLRDFYLRFSLLLNDMNIYNVKLEQFQVNTKFLNTLPSEWSKFVTDVKLVRDFHITNIDQHHAYLGQHEFHANEVRLMDERNSDPLALRNKDPGHVTSRSTAQDTYSFIILKPSIEYAPTVNQQQQKPEFSHQTLAVITSRYPTTNNQLRNSSNPRQQATINDGRITSPYLESASPEVIAPIDEVVAPEPVVSTSTPSSTIVDQDAPSPSNSQTIPETLPPIIPNDVEEDNHDIEFAHDDQFPLGYNYMSKLFSVTTRASSHAVKPKTYRRCFDSILAFARCGTIHAVVKEIHAVCTSVESRLLGDDFLLVFKRQKSAAISSTEAEYIALSGCCA
ncbi:hypothetical protein Tco_1123350 [Tanacetum coccineum]|uniref:Integrase, catalytic region, zinc finger, CCHC-type, peptidase aspartic, catalytic n=1 Tax=Tanacetum coccineum TaxID=301880 RepID=A0ABQ5J4S1_9ASTR